MDPVTHGLIGASFSQAAGSKKNLMYSALIGGTAAMLPDLDILISSPSDPLLQLEYHRQFTHSLIFIPFGALLCALIFWIFLRNKLSFPSIYLYSCVGMATAGFADIMTSYGVQLLWPFLESRYAANIISVFDPIFSIGIVTGLILCLYHSRKVFAWASIAWIILYLTFGAIQYNRAESAANEVLQSNSHTTERLVIKPTIANEILWSMRYVYRDTLYTFGVRLIPFDDPVIYEGQTTPLIDWRENYRDLKGSVLYEDIRRFERLSDGILIQHPQHPEVIGDGRYALLPTSVKPLWGIRVDTANPGQHAPFETFREVAPDIRNRFLNMLWPSR